MSTGLLARPANDASSLSLEGRGLSAVDVAVTLLTLAPAEAPTDDTWLTELAKVKPAPPPPAGGTAPLACPNKVNFRIDHYKASGCCDFLK